MSVEETLNRNHSFAPTGIVPAAPNESPTRCACPRIVSLGRGVRRRLGPGFDYRLERPGRARVSHISRDQGTHRLHDSTEGHSNSG